MSDAVVLLRELFDEGIAAVDTARSVERALREHDLNVASGGRLVLIAIGKASFAMASAAEDVLGERVDAGVAIAKAETPDIPSVTGRVVHLWAAHPVPDARSVAAANEILAVVDGLTAEDLVLVLISGGGSALVEAPRDPLTLDDIRQTTDLLLRAGAPIHDLNAVRSELSRIKGGGLRRAIGPARCVTIILSDVLGNDPSVIASGPTIARVPDPAGALAILGKYGITEHVPTVVIAELTRASQEDVAEDALVVGRADDTFAIIADNARFIEAIARGAERRGHHAEILWRNREGEARELAVALVDALATIGDDVKVVVGGGEATVTVRGDGIGGRNTEFALAAAYELERRQVPWLVASLASDGDDGRNAGAAGGFVDQQTIARARAAGLDPDCALATNDSGSLLAAIGGLFATDATGTNVNDAYIAIRLT